MLHKKTTVCIALVWILVFITLILSDRPPNLSWPPIPAHFVSSIGLAIVLSSLLIVFLNLSGAPLGWTSIVLGTIFVIALEFTQLISQARTFEFSDIYEGIAGLVPPTLLCVIFLKLLGRRQYLLLSNMAVAITFIAASTIIAFNTTEYACEDGRNEKKTGSFKLHQDILTAHTSKKGIVFCKYGGQVTVADSAIHFNGGGLRSSPLHNYFSKIRESRTFTIGIKFQLASITNNVPRVVATISESDTNDFFFRIIQAGSTIHVSVQTEKGKREGLSFHTIEPDENIVMLISHKAGQMNLWVADKKVGTIYSSLDHVTSDNPDAIINLGWRTDRRLNPFLGKVSSIFLSTQPLDDIAVTRIFRQLN